jgi:hypothetical protein
MLLGHLINDLKTRNSHYYQTNCAKDGDIAKDAAIIAKRMAALDAIPGMREGDFLRLKNGELARVAHNWGDSVQPTTGQGQNTESFYLGAGYIEYSGALEPSIPITEFRATGEIICGPIWIFHLDVMGSGRRVRAMAPFRVYEQVER